MSDIAIQVEHVKKKYRLGVMGAKTLRADLQTRMALRRGLEDPNTKIGTERQTQNEWFYALDDISFTIKKGERVAILGKNGAGKTTLLKLICRITAPTEGCIRYNGRVTSMLEVGTGFDQEMTGRENIYLSGAILGMRRKEVDKVFDRIVKFAEIGPFLDTPVKRYSSGMYIRLGFSVSAHLDADIVIMDEVLTVGDMTYQEKCIRRMREIAENENRTILYVSHNMFTVRELCDRCLVLDKGKLVYDGAVEGGEKIYRSENREADKT